MPTSRIWISLWFTLTTPIILWGAGYSLMRLRSLEGGDLRWVWRLYEIQERMDRAFGLEAFQKDPGFLHAFSVMNTVETALNVFYLYLTHVSRSPAAPFVGHTSAAMVVGQSVIYVLKEHFCGWCTTRHNKFRDTLIYWIIPNLYALLYPIQNTYS
ncbi:hypothetical protein BD779DRAFT_591743 [Infundibulicybe gibba]|nr:hypothetical protein BD779DRAFT_591743 [Infundibulicybe gibba]